MKADMSSALNFFIEENQPRFLEELKQLLRIPSVSTLPDHKDDVRRAAEFVAQKLRDSGMEHVELIEGSGHPLVVADWLHAPGKPTVLCYGHYDVQPADPLELWHSPPFEPVEREGNLVARGSADDKGQMYIHIKAVEALMKVNGKLPLNVKFLIEGEEEVGGASICEVCGGKPGEAESRRRAGERYEYVRAGVADFEHWASRPGLHGSGGDRPCA